MLVQLGNFPADDRLNTVLSAAFYVGGTLVGGYGILQRSGLRLTSAFYILSFALIVGGVWYFCYVESNLLARVYVLNLGMATLILSFAWRARRLFKGPLVDKLLLVMLVLVALQLVPRTLLTARSCSAKSTVRISRRRSSGNGRCFPRPSPRFSPASPCWRRLGMTVSASFPMNVTATR